MGFPLNRRAGLDFDLEVKGVNHTGEERVNALVQLMQERDPGKGIAGEEHRLSTPFVRRAMKGQLIWDEELGSEIAEGFCNLIEEDQEKLWENVTVESYRENWFADGPGEAPWNLDKPERKAPVMIPPSFSPGCLSIEETLNRLGRVRVRGEEWLAFCPAHETRHFSLVISESKYKPGEPVFFCYAGCTHQAVKAKVEELRG